MRRASANRGLDPYLFASVRVRADAGGAETQARRREVARSLPRLTQPSPLLPTRKPCFQGFRSGRYWARTSDPQLVERDQRVAVRRRLVLQALGRAGTRDNARRLSRPRV